MICKLHLLSIKSWLCSTECSQLQYSFKVLQDKPIAHPLWKWTYPAISLAKPLQPVTKAGVLSQPPVAMVTKTDYQKGSTPRNKCPLGQHARSFSDASNTSLLGEIMKSRSKVWEVVRKKGCREALKGRLAHLRPYNMVLTTLKRHSCWKAHVLPL